MKDKTQKPAIKQTEMQRLQNQLVGGASDGSGSTKPASGAKARMMKGARNACGPLNRRDWRWAGN